MTEEAKSQKSKKPIRLSPYYYVCMVGGIFLMSLLIDLGDSVLAAGLECGIGAALGIGVFHIGRYFLKGSFTNQSQEQTQTCSNCEFSEEIPQTSFDGEPDPKELKCNLTGYSYETTYTCNE